MRHRIALGVLLLAFLLWVPGISQPLITLDGSVDKARLVELGKQLLQDNPRVLPMIANMAAGLLDGLHAEGSIPAYHKTRSILGTVSELFRSGNPLVGFLVMLFSVIVPVAKGLLLLAGGVLRPGPWRRRVLHFSGLISKWSMADVFVVAVIVAYLAARATHDMGEIFTLDARFGPGFWFFLGYCLLSIVSAQLMPAQPAARQAGAGER